MSRYGEDAGNSKKKILFGMALVVLVALYIFVWPALMQKQAPVVQTDAGLPIPVAPTLAPPPKASKDVKTTTPAMVSPVSGK